MAFSHTANKACCVCFNRGKRWAAGQMCVSERHTRGNSSLIIIESPPSHAHNIMTKALLHRACVKLTGDVVSPQRWVDKEACTQPRQDVRWFDHPPNPTQKFATLQHCQQKFLLWDITWLQRWYDKEVDLHHGGTPLLDHLWQAPLPTNQVPAMHKAGHVWPLLHVCIAQIAPRHAKTKADYMAVKFCTTTW